MYKISKLADLSIFFNIIFIITPILNLYIILYSLVMKTLYIIRLQFIKNQYIIYVLFVILAK